MKRRLREINWPLLLAMILLWAVMASPVLGTTFISYLSVTNNSSTAYTYQPVIYSINNTYLTTNGYASNTTMLDVNIKSADGTDLSWMPVTDKTLFVAPSLPANSITSFVWSSGNSTADDSHEIVVGSGGYVTTADNATLEPGDSFALLISLYIKEATYTIFDKLNVLRADYNNTTDILTLTVGTFAAPDIVLTATDVTSGEHVIKTDVTFEPAGGSSFFSPTGAGSTTMLTPYGAATNWACAASNVSLESVCVYNDAPATNIKSDLYAFTFGTPSAFEAVTISFDAKNTYPVGYYAPLILMSGQPLYTGSTKLNSYAGHYTWTYDTNPITGLSWQVSDLTNTQFGIKIQDGSLGFWKANNYQVELVGASASYTPTLNLYIDDLANPVDSTTMAAAIPDNTNDWIWYPNPYINYIVLNTSN